MAKVCGNCAAESADDAKFCGSCGTPFAAAPAAEEEVGDMTVVRSAMPAAPEPPAAPPAPPAYVPPAPAATAPPAAAPPAYIPPAPAAVTLPPAAPGAVPPPPAYAAAPPAPRAPRAPMANPFAGVSIGDYLRDGAALVFLFTAFFKPWHYAERDYDSSDYYSSYSPFHHPWWAIVAISLALLSLAVPYLVKSGAVAGLTREAGNLLKVALNAPVFISAVVAVILSAAQGRSYDYAYGSGVALAVLGAAFAVQPRGHDEDPAHRDDALWRKITVALGMVAAIAIALGGFIWLIMSVTGDSSEYTSRWQVIVPVLVGALLIAGVLVALPLSAVIARRVEGTRVLGTIAVAWGVYSLFATVKGDYFHSDFGQWYTPLGYVFLIGAVGALALGRGFVREGQQIPAAAGWVATAKFAMITAAAAAAAIAIEVVIGMVASKEHPGKVIATLVLTLVAIGTAAAAAALAANPHLNRWLVIGLAAATIVLGIISGSLEKPLGELQFIGLWVLPTLAIVSLAIPKAVSAAYGPLVAPRAPAAPVQYQVGDIVNGHQFNGTAWVPVQAPPAPPAPPAGGTLPPPPPPYNG